MAKKRKRKNPDRRNGLFFSKYIHADMDLDFPPPGVSGMVFGIIDQDEVDKRRLRYERRRDKKQGLRHF